MFNIDEYRQIRKDYFGEDFIEATEGYPKYKAHCHRMNKYQQECINHMKSYPKKDNSPTKSISFLEAKKCLEAAKSVPVSVCYTPPVNWFAFSNPGCSITPEQEGKTPMRYNDNYASASATVQAPKSDAAVQRDYLINQLNDARYAKRTEFEKLFNLHVDNTPKTYKDMIDAIKNGKYTIDSKFEKRLENWDTEEDGQPYFGPLAGIVWDGPKSDYDGYHAALVEVEKQKTAAERIIVTGDAAAGLKALQDFEAWVPETGIKAN